MSKINEKPYSDIYSKNYVFPTKEKEREMYHFIADVLSHFSFHYIKRSVEINPTKITFNPAEAELQSLYHKWHNRWKHKQFEKRCLFTLWCIVLIGLILFLVLLFHELGIITLPEQLL